MDYDQNKIILKKIDLYIDLTGKKILEVGCGEGNISILIASKAREYIAIDPDRQSIAKAKSNKSDVDFRIGNGESLEFEDSSFHTVLFTLSLHHQNSQKALQEARRVLVEDGHLVILEPVVDSEVTQFFSLFNDETNRLMGALKAIDNCQFKLENKETFSTFMEFSHLEELCDFHFDRDHNHLSDRDRIIEKLQQLQWPINNAEPIRLSEELHIFSFRKKRYT